MVTAGTAKWNPRHRTADAGRVLIRICKGIVAGLTPPTI